MGDLYVIKTSEKRRNQMEVVALPDHPVHIIGAAIDCDFIYPLVEDMYSAGNALPLLQLSALPAR